MSFARFLLVLFLLFFPFHARADFDSDFSSDFEHVSAYLQTVNLALALKEANHYAALPRCSATQKPPCSMQDIVNIITKYANLAYDAVTVAQNAARDDSAKEETKQATVEAANAAISGLVKTIPAP